MNHHSTTKQHKVQAKVSPPYLSTPTVSLSLSLSSLDLPSIQSLSQSLSSLSYHFNTKFPSFTSISSIQFISPLLDRGIHKPPTFRFVSSPTSSIQMVTVNLGMLHYVLDHIYGAFMHRTRMSTPFFSRGWGGTKLDMLENMIRQLFPELAEQNWPPRLVQPVWRTVWETKTASLREGVFRTPCEDQLLAALPPESHIARVKFLMPKSLPPHRMACVVHLAGTGDHTFERRLRLGGPLVKENIATMVLESPFYGQRRPVLQRGAKLLCVSDLLLLGRATIEEARGLLHWLDSEEGFGKIGVCGLSMGGVHAAMVGSLHPTPIATLPFLSPHSAVVAFCEGILKHGTAWEALRDDLAAHKVGMTLEEVRERMRNVLSLTDVTRFPIPKNPNAVIFVAATDDGYIPKHSVMELQKAWPGSEVRWVTGGHVSSFLLHNDEFRRAIVDGLDRLPWKESPL